MMDLIDREASGAWDLAIDEGNKMSEAVQVERNENLTRCITAIASMVRKLRIPGKLSQGKLAHLAGLNRIYISDIERARRNPTLGVLLRVSKALGIGLADLVGASGVSDEAAG